MYPTCDGALTLPIKTILMVYLWPLTLKSTLRLFNNILAEYLLDQLDPIRKFSLWVDISTTWMFTGVITSPILSLACSIILEVFCLVPSGKVRVIGLCPMVLMGNPDF